MSYTVIIDASGGGNTLILDPAYEFGESVRNMFLDYKNSGKIISQTVSEVSADTRRMTFIFDSEESWTAYQAALAEVSGTHSRWTTTIVSEAET